MPRRASSGIQPQALLIGLAVLVLLLGGGYFVFGRKSSGFDAPQLDIEQALRNSRSLSGNRYQTSGKLVERRIEPNGQVIFLEMGEQSNLKHLPIIVPEEFRAGNLNPESDYTFLIEFNTQGVAVALDVKQL
jgi:hypothetical protein